MIASWLPRTLRVRLTAWHVAVMVVVLAIYAAAVAADRDAERVAGARRAVCAAISGGPRAWPSRGPTGSLSWFEGDPWK